MGELRRLFSALPVAALAALLLAACGGAPPSTTSAVPGSAATKPAAAAQPTAAAQPAATQAAASQAAATLHIGMPFMTSGPAAGFGQLLRPAFELGQDEVNSKGGITLGGKQYKLGIDFQDTAGKSEQALALVRKFADENKDLMILGSLTSTEAQVVFSQLQKKLDDPSDTGLQIVVFSPTAQLAGQGKIAAWSFRNVFDELKLIDDSLATLKKAKSLATAGVAVARDDAKSYQTWTDQIKPSLEKAGYQIADVEEVLINDTNVSAQVAKLKRANPDIWIISTLPPVGVQLLREAERQQFKPKVRLLMQSAVAAEFLALEDSIKDGILATTGYNLDDPKYAPYGAQLKAKGMKGLESGIQIQAYNAVLMTKDILEQAGLSMKPEDLAKDRRKIRDGFAQLKNWKGLAGDVFSMRDDHEVDRGGVIVEFKGGKQSTWQP